jgi:hypothetical protein
MALDNFSALRNHPRTNDDIHPNCLGCRDDRCRHFIEGGGNLGRNPGGRVSRLRVVLHVTTDSAGKLGVSLDSVDQGAMGLQGESVAFEGNAFSFEIPSVGGNRRSRSL